MTTKISCGLLILPDRIAESDLYVRDGSIAAVTDDPLPFDREIDAHGCYVAPGFIDTAGNDTWFDSFPDPEAERRRTIDLHPVKRIGTVEEVGALCVYLVSRMPGLSAGRRS